MLNFYASELAKNNVASQFFFLMFFPRINNICKEKVKYINSIGHPGEFANSPTTTTHKYIYEDEDTFIRQLQNQIRALKAIEN